MRIEELSIGDWVKVDIYHTPRRVMRVNMEWSDDGGSVYLMSVARKFGISVIDPIPLTAEILEKNGISKTYESDEYAVYKGEGFNVTEYYTELWEFERRRNRLMIRNVHQLQHAMRLAGIDKEIEL